MMVMPNGSGKSNLENEVGQQNCFDTSQEMPRVSVHYTLSSLFVFLNFHLIIIYNETIS